MPKRSTCLFTCVIFFLIILPLALVISDGQGKELKFTVEQLREDFQQMREAVERLHPAIYEFTDKKTFNALFDQQMAKVNRPMSEPEFFRIAAPMIARIGCGHSRLSKPKNYLNPIPSKLLPLDLRFLGGKTYLMQLYENTGKIPRGSEIVSINGLAITEIKKVLKMYVSADGYNDASKEYRLMHSFSLLFGLHYGFQDEYVIGYFPPGQSQPLKAVLQPVGAIGMLDYSSGQYRADRGKSIPDLRFEILEEKNTAVITITTFAYYDERDVFYAFLDDAFEKIHTSKIDNLVLDFRDNDGGNPFCTTHLLSHIEPYPVPYFAKLYIGYGRFAQPIPLAGKRFKGDIYILINGGCFSSTGHLCALLKYHKIGMFIGTETGGTYTCNDASKEIILKHTQFRLITARRTFQAAVRGLPKDKGILPDYPVEPTIEDLLNGKDTVLEFTLALLDTKMHSGTLAPSVLK